MAPTRKSKSVNKRFSYASDVPSKKKGENADKSGLRKRKLSDMLGPQWSKEELERFYEAYRKYGKEWNKVAAAVRNRSVEMVEALFTMNRAYLSLPEGTASVVGLIAMMTDHYGVLEGTDSEQESNDGAGASRKFQRCIGAKNQSQPSKGSDGLYPDLLQFQSAASNYGCMSLLKKRRSGSRPRAVAKRTPRVPVSYTYNKDNMEKYLSPIRPGLRPKVGTIDDDVAHEIALVLTEASQRGGSPQVSQTPSRKRGTPPVQNGAGMHDETEMTSSKLRGSEMDEDGCELSLGSTEADNGYYARDRSYLMETSAGTVAVQKKAKRSRGKKRKLEENVNLLDDIKEACSGTEEVQKIGGVKGKFGMVVTDEKISRSSSKNSRKRSKKVLFKRDEGSAFDALQTLADLSLMMPESTVDTESSMQLKEDKRGIVDESKQSHSGAEVKVTASRISKLGKYSTDNDSGSPEADGNHRIYTGSRTKRQKFLPFKLRMDAQIPKPEYCTDSQLDKYQKIEATNELKKLVSKGKRTHSAAQSKQGKLVKPSECSPITDNKKELTNSRPSTTHALSTNQVNLPAKVRSRRKNARKLSVKKDSKSSEDLLNNLSYGSVLSFSDGTLKVKEQLSNCLSLYQLRRWFVFEWFYSAIDYPWFARREFMEYLDHVGLSHVPTLTRVEWGVIKSSLGRPRRFSEQFLKEEKEKLNQYRESVRTHYSELHAGTRDGLPTDLAQPLYVGQQIIAVHSRTREIHNGSVLTVDRGRYRVQFDQRELGVEFVRDIDCMPLNPHENVPATLSRQNVAFGKFFENLNELKTNVQPKERNTEGYMKFGPSCEHLENTNGAFHISPSANYQINSLLQERKVKAGPSETVYMPQTASQPPIIAQMQAKQADVHALSELTRVLDKKEAVVSELRRMNDEVLENQKDGDNSFKNSEHFKKQYAAILLQLNEINEQVSSALFCLRQRNTYQGSIPLIWSKPLANLGDPGGDSSSFDHSAYQTQESGSHVAEIVDGSRTKAQKMVDAAVQAISSLQKGGNGIERIEEAMDFVNNRLSVHDLGTPSGTSSIPVDSVHSTLTSQAQDQDQDQDQPNMCTSNPLPNNHAPDSKLNNLSDENTAQIPSELIANCVATLLMIQKCTERQFPPGDVAQVLDSAVTSLQPRCSQNLPIYAEIQKCMGIIRNQILALIPT